MKRLDYLKKQIVSQLKEFNKKYCYENLKELPDRYYMLLKDILSPIGILVLNEDDCDFPCYVRLNYPLFLHSIDNRFFDSVYIDFFTIDELIICINTRLDVLLRYDSFINDLDGDYGFPEIRFLTGAAKESFMFAVQYMYDSFVKNGKFVDYDNAVKVVTKKLIKHSVVSNNKVLFTGLISECEEFVKSIKIV